MGERSAAPIIKSLLRESNYHVLTAQVPAFGSEIETVLIRKLESERGVMERYRIMRILAFRGGTAAFSAITNALCAGFRGRHVTSEEQGVLGYAPTLLGLMTSRDGRALVFLKAGMNPAFWRGKAGWICPDGKPVHPVTLAESCVRGLAYADSHDVVSFLERCRRHPEEIVAIDHLSGAINEAAFIFHMVRSLGAEQTMDRITSDPYGYFRQWEEWTKEDPEGQEWYDWGGRASSLRGPR